MRDQRGLALRCAGGLVVEHPPLALKAGILALHQAVQPQRLALVHQVHLIALPGQRVGAPGPGARAGLNTLRQRGRRCGLRRTEAKLARHGSDLLRRHTPAPFQQTVHGLTDAGAGGVFILGRFSGWMGRHRFRQRGQLRQVENAGVAGRGASPFGGICQRRRQFAQQAVQALPPAVGGRPVRLYRGNHQRMARSRQGHIQRVELLAFARGLLGCQRLLGAGGRAAFADQKDKFAWLAGLARPVDQHAHAVGVALHRVGVQQQHGLGLQPFGAVDRQQPNGAVVQRGRRQRAAGLERAYKAIGRGVAPAIKRQRHAEQRAQVGQHGLALDGRRGGDKARQHIAVGVNGLQRVVRRQAVQPALPAGQMSRQPLQIGRE